METARKRRMRRHFFFSRTGNGADVRAVSGSFLNRYSSLLLLAERFHHAATLRPSGFNRSRLQAQVRQNAVDGLPLVAGEWPAGQFRELIQALQSLPADLHLR